MSVWEEIGLVTRHELKRNLKSAKGIVMFALFLLGGAVPALIMILVEHAQKLAQLDKMSPEQQQQVTEKALYGFYRDHPTAHYLSQSPGALFFLLQGTLTVLPLLALIIGFDQIAGEIQHRAIRYLVGRAHRPSIVVGKALGIWGVVAIMILVLHSVVWIMMIAQGEHGVGETLSWGVRFWAFSVASAGASVGLASLVSSWFKAPILSLFTGVGVGFALFVARAIVAALSIRYEWMDSVKWAFPASYESLMVKPDALDALSGCAADIVWGGALVGLAAFIVQKKDV